MATPDISLRAHKRWILFFLSTLLLIILLLPYLAIADVIQLPQTGQTTCYDLAGAVIPCAGTGQDGDIQAGVRWPDPRFKDNGDGTITDDLTGLMWTQNANAPEAVAICQGYYTLTSEGGVVYPYASAGYYINCLNAIRYLGYNDWRIPDINELLNLVNVGQPNLAAWLNTQGFSNVQSYYWSSTSTPYAYQPSSAWTLRMWDGLANAMPWVAMLSVWPVRLSTSVALPTHRFTDNGDETVTDNLTGLMWTQNARLPSAPFSYAFYMSWRQALDYVKGMNVGTYPNLGYTNWRLPNRVELQSLIDFSRYGLALPLGHPFLNLQETLNFYWSSSTVASSPDRAWLVNMWNGRPDAAPKSYITPLLWPVRTSLCQNNGQIDTDCDGLADIVETNTKIFIDQNNTGTDSNNPDTDGDALLDGWEVNGHNELDLRAMGANPLHKDIFVEVDWMKDDTVWFPNHHRPSDQAMQVVIGAFAAAPPWKVNNPDGKWGINLYVDYGQDDCTWCQGSNSFPHQDEFGWVNGQCDDSTLATATQNFKDQYNSQGIKNFGDNRRDIFHYALFIHNMCLISDTGGHHSGKGGVPGQDFIVALGDWGSNFIKLPACPEGKTTCDPWEAEIKSTALTNGGTLENQAGTFMHELGHNLGLTHGGPILGSDGKPGDPLVDDDGDGNVDEPDEMCKVPVIDNDFNAVDVCYEENHKPNYLSVMNYFFQGEGLILDGQEGLFDYSRFSKSDILTLDEEHLNEPIGLKDGTGTSIVAGSGVLGTRYYCDEGSDPILRQNANSAIDWNCLDGMTIDTQENINNNDPVKTHIPVLSKLRSFDDWSNLIYNGGGVIGHGISSGYPVIEQTELTDIEFKKQKPVPPINLSATSNLGSITLQWDAADLDSIAGFYIYRKTGANEFQRIGASLSHSFIDNSVVGGTLNTYGVTTVNVYENESEIWSTVSIITHVFSGFLPPIQNDNTSVFKLGSTVPVKFQLMDSFGNPISSAEAKLKMQKFSDSVPSGDPIDATSTIAATEGNTFRYDGDHYIFNLNTKSLSVGTWQIQVLLNDGTVRSVFIGLK